MDNTTLIILLMALPVVIALLGFGIVKLHNAKVEKNAAKTYVESTNYAKGVFVKYRSKFTSKDKAVATSKNSASVNLATLEFDNKFIVSSNPHVFGHDSTRRIMLDVIIALLPATVASFIFFGLNALYIVLLCVASSVFFEWAFNKITKRPNTTKDLSATLTGLLLALNLPAVGFKNIWWPCIVGSLIAIVVVKCLFGGLGKNFANPAITARVMLLIAFSTVGASVQPVIGDITSGATPLPVLGGSEGTLPQLWQMFVGMRGGALGETSALALLIGGIYLICRRVISWHTPVVFIGTVFVLTFLIKSDVEYALYQILSGGLFIGAIFMATDYVTTPTRPLGRCVFALGCALITVVIRVWGTYPEGVSFSILFMNLLTPYIDRLTAKRPFGGAR